MKLAIALLLMTTTLGAGSAVLAAGLAPFPTPDTSLARRTAPGPDLTLIEDDGDEDGGWLWSGLNDDDDDEDDDDDACDDDDQGGDGCTTGAAGDAAKAGTVAPPKNGLFTDGTAPVVKSN
jgi:hypothetical protein